MARRKSQPRYKQNLTVDKRGYFRIGGKFASKRQVSAWQRERKKRNLKSTVPRKPSSATVKRNRKAAAKKAAITRRVRRTGTPPVKTTEFRTVFQRSYTIPLFNVDIFSPEIGEVITDLFERERLEELKAPLVYVVLVGEDDEGNDVSFSTRFVGLNSDDSINRLTGQIVGMAQQYEMVLVNELVFVVSYAKG